MISVSRKIIGERWNASLDILREAVFSPLNDEALEVIVRENHLSEIKYKKLSELCLYVLLGIINSEDLYKEIRDGLQIDPRLALEIYHQVDKKIFEPIRKEIEDNFIRFKIGAIKESEIFESQPVAPQIVLKKENPEIINLRTEAENIHQPLKLKIETGLPVEKLKEPAPVSLGGISIAQTETPNVISEASKTSAQTASQSSVLEGPFMLHKKEESQSISQTQAEKNFGGSSYGGFLGSSMKSFGVQKPQDSVSTAKIEMPFDKKPLNGQEMQKVPVVVKKYEQEQAKTIHYSAYKSSLEKDVDGSVKTIVSPIPQQAQQPKKPEAKNEGMIDLTNLTLNK